MPYISEHDRALVHHAGPATPGELNYAITLLIANFIKRGELSYQVINDVIGALEGAKLEFNRRIVAPYEDTKLCQNGDVYPQTFKPEPL